MLIRLPYKAISTNKLYLGAKVVSGEYKKFQREVEEYLRLNYPPGKKFVGNLVMHLEAGFSNPLSDCSNAIKGIEDSIAKHFGFNDKQIVSHHIHKYLVDKGKEYMVVKLLKTSKNIDRRTKKNVR